MKVDQPTLSIPFDNFDKSNPNPNLDERGIVLPNRTFPPRFLIDNARFLCAGYFVSYKEHLNPDKLAKLCMKDNWKSIANYNGDFLIFFWNKVKRELCVLTGQHGKFPCYFCVSDNKFIVSTALPYLKEQRKYSLNLDMALDYVTTGLFLFIYDQTLLNEISRIPPAALLRVNQPPKFSLEPLVNLKKVLSISPTPASSNQAFTHEFLNVLEDSVARRIKAVGNLNFGAELSSGLDSSLICYLLHKLTKKKFICYCGYCESEKIGTDVEIVKNFARKYNLLVAYQLEDQFFPFSHPHYMEVVKGYPPSITIDESAYESFKFAKKNRLAAYFQGLGGDEVYDSYLLDFWAPFKIQEFYFMLAWRFKLGIDKILTKEGLKRVIERGRFEKLRIYPSVYSASAVNDMDFFSLAWNSNTWPLTPFIDPEVVQFVRMRLPRKGLKAPSKIEILKNLRHIFIEKQFREKVGDENLFNKFLREKRKLLITILNKSVLRDTGLFQIDKLLENLKSGHIDSYLEGDASFYLLYLLRLEYFLQNNDVKIL